jgi:transcriptional regulator with XRE-family HTH domain
MERGLSVKALAAEASVSDSTIKRVEHSQGGAYPDTLRKLLAVLHKHAALTEQDAVEIADASRLSRAAVIDFLRRVRPLLSAELHTDPAHEIDRWRIRCYALVDRLLARAKSPEQVEIALVAMVSAFESALPPAPDSPILTRREDPVVRPDGATTQTTTHYQARGG